MLTSMAQPLYDNKNPGLRGIESVGFAIIFLADFLREQVSDLTRK
jgi:hypothetical protein